MSNLQEGKEAAKIKFLAKSLTELTLNDDFTSIRLFHPDVYNFQVTINGKGNHYFGTLEQALIKVFKLLYDDVVSQEYGDMVSCYKKVKPCDKCDGVNLSSVMLFLKSNNQKEKLSYKYRKDEIDRKDLI